MRVFSCIPLPDHVDSAFRDAFSFTVASPGAALEELRSRADDGDLFDAIVTSLGAPRLTAAEIDRLPPTVRMIATYSVGTEHIDLDAARRRGLAVSSTPGTLVASVAETAMLLMLGAARRVTESVALVRGGGWTGWSPRQLNGMELAGKTLGIYGMGEIGEAVAVRARAFGMAIAYHNRRRRDGVDATFIPDADALMGASDVLLLAAPSTPETRGFVNAARLRTARPSLVLVNIARGDLVVDDDLIAALKERRIFAAGLDVFANEPDFDRRYLALPNLFMLPHIGSSTLEARLAMAESVIRSIRAFFAGESDPARIVEGRVRS